ncbi:MAG: hypothetical protein QME81_03310 [bacterium]|nr:hypothetical protein [bacterium]
MAVDFDQYRKEKRIEYAQRLAKVRSTFSHRVARGRPRDPGKHRLLLRLDHARMKRKLASGEIERLGPRLWRVNYPEFKE